jgi:integrase/recombinase XerC
VRQFCLTVANLLGGFDLSLMEMVGQREIDRVASSWSDQGVLPQTIARRFSAVRNFAGYLCLALQVNCSKILAAHYPTAPKLVQPAMTDLCYANFATGPDTIGRWTEARDQAAFAVMEAGALTSSETVGLNYPDLLRTVCSVAITTPGRSVRIAPLTHEAFECVDLYQSIAPFRWHSGSPLFVNWRGRRLSVRSVQVSFRNRADGLGLPPSASPMSLRHRAAQRMADAGHPPAFVADRLGIAVSSVARYYGGALSSQPSAAAKRGNR